MTERNNPGEGMIAQHRAARMARPLPDCQPQGESASTPAHAQGGGQASAPDRAALRLRSLRWALIGGVSALTLGLLLGLALTAPPAAPGTAALLEPALRAGGCGFFQGLLAFHLQRVDPDDGHLQAGLVGAVCGIHSLALPLELGWPAQQPLTAALTAELLPVMMELIRAWLPIVGGALVLYGVQRLTPALRP
jgi:hypothetical protein